MKMNNLFHPVRAIRSLVLAAITLLGAGAAQADSFFYNAITATGTGGGTVDFSFARGGNTGMGNCWAVFSLSGGVTLTDPVLGATTDYDVVGNVGVANGGTLLMDRARIGGQAWVRSAAVPSMIGGSTITLGMVNQPIIQSGPGDALLAATQAAAYNAANQANALGHNTAGGTLTVGGATPLALANPGGFLDQGSIAFSNVGGSISGQAGQTYVLNLTNLILAGSAAVLNLSGTDTTNYVINVSKFMSLAQGAKIVLSGGLKAENVVYNVRNSYGYDVTLSSASEVSGIILAANRNVKLTGDSKVYGEVIARAVSLSGSSNVINPVCSP